MTSLDIIKSNIKNLYETSPNIHINISMTHPKICLRNDPAIIKGVYPHIFIIEEHCNGFAKCHALQYTDVMTKRIEILELEIN